MKKLYFRFFQTAFLMFMLLYYSKQSFSQCPSGQPAGSTAFDTTIVTPEGINSLQLKFPKFDPESGLVTCVNLCVTITGIVDSVSIENNSSSSQTADVYYTRTDQITGPGLSSPLTNSVNQHYGTYTLDPKDGFTGSGPDFISISHDTVLNAKSICQTISDSTAISNFYGTDSVTYTYDISAFTSISCTGGNYNSSVSTSAFVNFHFSYCTCPSSALPLNIQNFSVSKQALNKAQLSWKGFDDLTREYHYEIQISHNGRDFTTIDTVQKNIGSSDYRYIYTTGKSENPKYFFRIKQVYSNGYPRFSEVKSIELENSDAPKINIYPNPSSGVVGIKFVNSNSGKFLVQISNTQGQTVFSNEVEANGGLKYITTLQRGVYWLRLIDVTSHLSCVNQLLIK
jgi:hypothetical protein